jgi:hypothetical protein
MYSPLLTLSKTFSITSIGTSNHNFFFLRKTSKYPLFLGIYRWMVTQLSTITMVGNLEELDHI